MHQLWHHPILRRLLRFLFDLVLILIGAVLMALAVDIFFDPNDVVPGGFTALAIFANRLWGLPTGITLLALNIPFLLLGMWVLGADFGPKTIFATTAVSLSIDLLRPYVPTVTGEPLLYIAYGGVLFGAGLALVFRANATSGGTEIPAKLLEHFFGIRMAQSLLAMDVAILAGAAFLFGLTPALYALIAAWVMARVVDKIDLGFNATITAFIVTERPDAVREAILRRLDRGVTLLEGEGGYTGSRRIILFTVVRRPQVGLLREIVSAADPAAFMVINPSTDVLGEGFRPLPRPRG